MSSDDMSEQIVPNSINTTEAPRVVGSIDAPRPRGRQTFLGRVLPERARRTFARVALAALALTPGAVGIARAINHSQVAHAQEVPIPMTSGGPDAGPSPTPTPQPPETAGVQAPGMGSNNPDAANPNPEAVVIKPEYRSPDGRYMMNNGVDGVNGYRPKDDDENSLTSFDTMLEGFSFSTQIDSSLTPNDLNTVTVWLDPRKPKDQRTPDQIVAIAQLMLSPDGNSATYKVNFGPALPQASQRAIDAAFTNFIDAPASALSARRHNAQYNPGVVYSDVDDVDARRAVRTNPNTPEMVINGQVIQSPYLAGRAQP